jgi:hypothetical protein
VDLGRVPEVVPAELRERGPSAARSRAHSSSCAHKRKAGAAATRGLRRREQGAGRRDEGGGRPPRKTEVRILVRGDRRLSRSNGRASEIKRAARPGREGVRRGAEVEERRLNTDRTNEREKEEPR